ncbi:MAG: hypothetical protein WC030_00765 [Candidatus Paceibacterota bacterium]
MEYLYHRVPKNMVGTVLYPLNVLKVLYPVVYREHVAKYEGRSHLLLAEVPVLHCLWNDVLHFTAVEPHVLKETLKSAGVALSNQGWFKVPVSLVEGDDSIAFIYTREERVMPNALSRAKEYAMFSASQMDTYRHIPDETIEYYKDEVAAGREPLMFHLVAHILYKGTLETKDLEVVYP